MTFLSEERADTLRKLFAQGILEQTNAFATTHDLSERQKIMVSMAGAQLFLQSSLALLSCSDERLEGFREMLMKDFSNKAIRNLTALICDG